MKQIFFKKQIPKYRDFDFDKLRQALLEVQSSRQKAPILINLGLLEESDELYELLLDEVRNKDNIKTKEFSTLSIAMISAIGIIQLGNQEYINKLKNVIREIWDNYSIEDFDRILKSEGIKFSFT